MFIAVPWKKPCERIYERMVFELFYQVLEEKGLIAEKGIIVDASFKEVPVQRNSKEENARIKNGEMIEEWSEDKRRQVDARSKLIKNTGSAVPKSMILSLQKQTVKR